MSKFLLFLLFVVLFSICMSEDAKPQEAATENLISLLPLQTEEINTLTAKSLNDEQLLDLAEHLEALAKTLE